MQEIRCPNCGQVFQVDESGYAQIVQQVRDREFAADVERRAKELTEKKENDDRIARMAQEKTHGEELAKKESELAEKQQEIERLKARISSAEMEKELAVSQAVQGKEKEISDKNSQIVALQGALASKETESELKVTSLKNEFQATIKMKDEQIEYYKDFKARQSTKMVGESLEQHCLTEFNKIRMTAFPSAYFEKDNDAKTGSKGDFIFRETAEDGTEFISIMFEMKNEMDTTATKHRNEDFFKELDKDRREKNCEYAVLVSLLESESEYYNSGIVDVSYRYEKMYVIRPQFFIPMITLLRNAAKNSLQYRQELQIVKNQQLDILNFEKNMNTFKTGFAKNYELASRKFKEAIEDIDRTIKALEKTKADLLSSDRNLRLANDKAQDLSIKKLTKDAPSVRAMFEEIQEEES